MSSITSTENKHRYTSSRLNHIVSSLPYAFASLFCKRDSNLIVFCAMHCETFDSNSKFLFLHFLKNEPDYVVKFVINNDQKREELIRQYGDHFIDTRTKEGKRIAIEAKYWVVSWLDLPLGGLFLRFRRLTVHLGHGTPLKGLGMTEKDGKLIKKLYYKLNNTNITYSLGSSDFVAKIISRCMGFSTKRVLVAGQPRTDALFYKPYELQELSKNNFNVLYAPTWRQFAEVKLFPFEDFDLEDLNTFLNENNIHMFIRFHPAYEETIPQEILSLNNISLFSAKKYNEVMDYINCFDSLITDYSSIYLDYMLLERPIIFLPYDLQEYENSVGFTMDYMENTPGPKPISFNDFKEQLLKAKNDNRKMVEEIKILNKKLNNSNHNACEQVADFIKNYYK